MSKLKFEKVPSKTLEKVNLFSQLLNLSADEDDDFDDETFEKYEERISQTPARPKRITVKEGFSSLFKVSLEYDEKDISEVALFKAAVVCDQDRFSHILNEFKFDPAMKNHVLGWCVRVACIFRDIRTVKFLKYNGLDIINLSIISDEGVVENIPSVTCVVNSWCDNSFFDEELVDLLLDSGLNLKDKYNGSTIYFHIMDSVPKEFSIKMLNRVTDINETQYRRKVKKEGSSYVDTAINLGLFALAQRMIESGAKIEQDKVMVWLEKAVRIYNNFGFVKFLFDENYINSLENMKEGHLLLVESLAHKNYEMFLFFMKKGAKNINVEYNAFEFFEKDGMDVYISVNAPTIFTRLIELDLSEDFLLKVFNISNIELDACLDEEEYYNADAIKILDFYLYLAIWSKKYELAKVLIDLGADVNTTLYNDVPLRLVIEDGHFEMAYYLVKKGAKSNYLCGLSGKNALQQVIDDENEELIDLILDNAVDVKDAIALALYTAICEEDISTINKLVSKGIDFSEEDYIYAGHFPLIEAIYCNNVEICKVLISSGVDVNFVDGSGRSVSMIAIEHKNVSVCELLQGAVKLNFVSGVEIERFLKNNQNNDNSGGAFDECMNSGYEAVLLSGAVKDGFKYYDCSGVYYDYE